jgi:hypothetical protein
VGGKLVFSDKLKFEWQMFTAEIAGKRKRKCSKIEQIKYIKNTKKCSSTAFTLFSSVSPFARLPLKLPFYIGANL